MLNKIILVGRLTKDPKKVKVGEDEFATFSLAFNQSKNEKGESLAEFIDCSAGVHLTKAICENLVKGDKIAVSGRFANRKWKDKDGNARSSATVYVDDVEFIDVLKFNEEADEGEPEEEPWNDKEVKSSPKEEPKTPSRRTRR